MGLPDCRGVATSCASATAIAALDRAHERNLAFQGDAVADIDEVLVGQPDFVMGHVFKAGLLTQTMETRIYDDMVRSVQHAEALWDTANERERGHIRAVRAWVDGDFFGAVQHWEATLTTCPLDLLALQLVHLTDVLLGDVVGQRDCVARVFPLWDESIPGYEFVLGFYSFGLEENRDFGEAEELGRRALAMRPNHPYAVHAVAHVMEMKGRQSGGISFMNRYLPDWSRSDFANHLQSADPHGDKYEELDAAALLWRLELLDVDVGDRWSRLADKWQPSAQDTLYAFNDVHAMMCFVADHRTEAANKLINANARYVNHATDANVAMSREMGCPSASRCRTSWRASTAAVWTGCCRCVTARIAWAAASPSATSSAGHCSRPRCVRAASISRSRSRTSAPRSSPAARRTGSRWRGRTAASGTSSARGRRRRGPRRWWRRCERTRRRMDRRRGSIFAQ